LELSAANMAETPLKKVLDTKQSPDAMFTPEHQTLTSKQRTTGSTFLSDISSQSGVSKKSMSTTSISGVSRERSEPAHQKQKSRSRLDYSDSGTENDEDGQRWTPPPRTKKTVKKTRSDTPDPRHLETSKRSSSSDKSSLASRSRVSFEDIVSEQSSDSEADVYLSSTQPRHYLKPPKFNGTSTFETFYAQFENCAKYNRWDRSEQLAHLKAALTDAAGQVLWDCSSETTSSLSKLVKLLKERFGGAVQSDKYRMELRNRRRQSGEALQVLYQDIRRLTVLAYPGLEAKSREIMACDYFLDSLNDANLKLKVRERNPGTLDDALRVAIMLEVWEKDASHDKSVSHEKSDEKGKAKNTRYVEVNAGSTVKALTQKLDGLISALQNRVNWSTATAQPAETAAEVKSQVPTPGSQPTATQPNPSATQPTAQQPQPHPAQPNRWTPSGIQRPQRKDKVWWNGGEKGHLQFSCPAMLESSAEKP